MMDVHAHIKGPLCHWLLLMWSTSRHRGGTWKRARQLGSFLSTCYLWLKHMKKNTLMKSRHLSANTALHCGCVPQARSRHQKVTGSYRVQVPRQQWEPITSICEAETQSRPVLSGGLKYRWRLACTCCTCPTQNHWKFSPCRMLQRKDKV